MELASNQKTVSIHQPNYFPWLGYFYKIARSDVFVLHDNVQHSKRYPTRRTQIRRSYSEHSPSWLTVPLRKHSDFDLIRDLTIDNFTNWRLKHLNKLKGIYSASPYFESAYSLVEQILEKTRDTDKLSQLNNFIIKSISGWLELKSNFIKSSDLPIKDKASNYNVLLVKHLEGTAYLSGQGGNNYQSETDFIGNNIQLIQSDFMIKMEQHFSGLPVKLSILDLIFMQGIESVKGILQTCTAK